MIRWMDKNNDESQNNLHDTTILRLIRQIIIYKITCTRNDQFLINYPVKQLIRGRSWNAMQLDQRKFLASHERHSRDIVTFNREMIAAWHKSTWTGLISFYDNARCFPLFRLIINHEGNVNPRIAHIYIYILLFPLMWPTLKLNSTAKMAILPA